MSGPPRILIVDDSFVDAELAQWHLEKAGMCCTASVQYTEAGFVLDLTRWIPQAILLDLNIPGFDPFTALRIAKSLVPTVPVILWTGGGVRKEEARRALAEGAHGCADKDNPETLVALFRQVLGEPLTA